MHKVFGLALACTGASIRDDMEQQLESAIEAGCATRGIGRGQGQSVAVAASEVAITEKRSNKTAQRVNSSRRRKRRGIQTTSARAAAGFLRRAFSKRRQDCQSNAVDSLTQTKNIHDRTGRLGQFVFMFAPRDQLEFHSVWGRCPAACWFPSCQSAPRAKVIRY